MCQEYSWVVFSEASALEHPPSAFRAPGSCWETLPGWWTHFYYMKRLHNTHKCSLLPPFRGDLQSRWDLSVRRQTTLTCPPVVVPGCSGDGECLPQVLLGCWKIREWCFNVVLAELCIEVFFFLTNFIGTSLVIQCLRLCPSSAGGTGSVPGWGTKIPHAIRCG